MLAFTVTHDSINLIIDGVNYGIPRSAAQAAQILDELKKPQPDKEQLKKLSDLVFALELYTGNDCTIRKDGVVIRNGQELPPALGRKVLDCFKTGTPYTYLLAFFDKLNSNPSKTAVHELYDFLEHMGFAVCPDGNLLGYKGVQEDMYSVHGGDSSKLIQGTANSSDQILNSIGSVIEVTRNYVEDNRDIGCASGLICSPLFA